MEKKINIACGFKLDSEHVVCSNGELKRILKDGRVVRKNEINSLTGKKVSLTSNGKNVFPKMHDIIYEAFNEAPVNGYIHHKDLNFSNNNIDNLYCLDKPYEYLSISHEVNGIRIKNINQLLWIGEDGNVYELSNDGKFTVKHMKPNKVHGYIYLNTTINGARKNKRVHTIVADAFIQIEDESHNCVDHKDEDKTNNCSTNLRRCTIVQNTEFYNTKNGRDWKLKLRRDETRKTKEMLDEIVSQKREIVKLKKELLELHKLLDKKENRIQEGLEKISIRNINYDGYKDVAGERYGSIEKMVESTGKKIIVDGQEFRSCGAASTYIYDKELALGNVRNKDTICKTLRNYVNGKLKQWSMYNRYTIGF